MGLTAKTKSSSEGWGLGFLLVFFPEDEPIDINKKKTDLFSSSSSPSPSPSPPPPSSSLSSSSSSTVSSTFKPAMNSPLRRSTSRHLLSRAQSTISICALLIFITLLVFTLSTFEPTTTTTNHFTSRRHLSSNPSFLYKSNRRISHSPSWSIKILSHNSHYKPEITATPSYALQGMGNLYRRGTKAMNDLIVGHIMESVTAQELRLFLRLFHRSGLTSRSDLVLIFPSLSNSAALETVIREENESFSKLIHRRQKVNGTKNSTTSFDVSQFVKSSKKEKEWGESIWGRRIRSNYSEDDKAESTRLSYGSVVSFLVDELDPENSLAGFFDYVPMSLRRWACYPMLLGRVRRNFKHVMLVDVKEVLPLGDPLSRARTRRPESVQLSTEATTPNKKHGKKNSVKTQSHTEKPVNSAVIMGGARGVRRLSNAMLTEIVRATTEHKRKNSVTESGLFNQLVGNEFILKNVNVVVTFTQSIPDASSLTGLNSNSGYSSLSNYTVVRRGNSNINLTSSIMKQICSLEVDSTVYCDC